MPVAGMPLFLTACAATSLGNLHCEGGCRGLTLLFRLSIMGKGDFGYPHLAATAPPG